MSTPEAPAIVNIAKRPRYQRWGYTGSVLLASLTLANCGGKDSAEVAPSQTVGPGKKVLLEGSVHKEVQQQPSANTFADYEHVAGFGPEIKQGTEVAVDCLATGPVEAAPTADGKWYHLTTSPDVPGSEKYAGYFVAANTFENGDTSGELKDQPAVDPAVPDCPK